MRTPVRVQRKHVAGWSLPPGTICVDRSTKYGNPFRVGDIVEHPLGYGRMEVRDNNHAKVLFDNWLDQPAQAALVKSSVEELRGHDLACWCALSEPCHAEVWLRRANNLNFGKVTA